MVKDIGGNKYKVINVINNITLADCAICRQNKIGTGHGERKLYVGNEGDKLTDFFEGFTDILHCFALKAELKEYLNAVKNEYLEPSQEYAGKQDFSKRYELLNQMIEEQDDIISFDMNRSDIRPPRVYINAVGTRSEMRQNKWRIIGDLALPNITTLSIMKVELCGNIFYYFKMQADFENFSINDENELRNIENELYNDTSLTGTERKAIIMARRGQGFYRKKLLEEIVVCPFTLVDDKHLLVASHIKPWKVSNNKEKIDNKNGIVLTPTYDRLFDKGYISFTDDKKLIISPWLDVENRERLYLKENMILEHLPVLDEERKIYLCYHREYVLKK